MADVSVKLEMDADWEEVIKTLPSVKGALTKGAQTICATANSNARGFRSGIYRDKKSGREIGNTPASYGMKPARVYGGDSVAIVYTANYAAQKDNLKNNTLLKAVAHG